MAREVGAALAVVAALAAVVARIGTFHHGAASSSLFIGGLLLIALAWAGRHVVVDPLGLQETASRAIPLGAAGGSGSLRRRLPWAWLPFLLWLSVVASWLFSPVSRAGEAFVLFLLPAIWAAAGIGRLLGSPRARQWTISGVALVAVSVSAWALWWRPLHEQGRAALPIGHHNQLALVLVALLPVAALGGWRMFGGLRFRLGLLGGLLVSGVIAWTVGATGSFAGYLALLLQVVAASFLFIAVGGRRAEMRRVTSIRAPLAVLVLLPLLATALVAGLAASRTEVPGPLARVGALIRLEDPSLEVRRTYAEAAFDGFGARPVLGWGPGSASWTLARHWQPAPGVHPPGEVITDAHSLLAQAPYEVGLLGTIVLFALALRYGARRLGDLVRAARAPPGTSASEADTALAAASLLGLLGAGVCLLFGVFATITAVPAVLVLNFGLAEAARRAATSASPPSEPEAWWAPRLRLAAFCWLGLAAVWSIERAVAARSYERGMAVAMASAETSDAEPPAEAWDLVRQAAALDPGFPLYRARFDPWSAAVSGDGLAPLWLLAGTDIGVGPERRREALERACDLDPLSALAPFELMLLERQRGTPASDAPVAARAARAIIAEPLLLAASAFEGDPDLRSDLYRRIVDWPGLPPGWLAAFEELWFALDWSNGGQGPARDVLSVEADGQPALSFSLFAFRRPPWPLSIGAVPLRSHRLAAVEDVGLPAVTHLPQTAPSPFRSRRCGLE